MYYIKKYADCWAIHNDSNGKSRELTEEERTLAEQEFAELKDEKLRSVFIDEIRLIPNLP